MRTALRTPLGLDLSAPCGENSPWIATVGEGTPTRLSPDLGIVLKWFQDGSPSILPSFPDSDFDETDLLEATNLLEDAGLLTQKPLNETIEATQRSRRRLHFNSFFSIQFDILNRLEQFAWLSAFATRGFLRAMTATSAVWDRSGLYWEWLMEMYSLIPCRGHKALWRYCCSMFPCW